MKNINASKSQRPAFTPVGEYSTHEGSLDMALLFRQAALLQLHLDLKWAIGRPGKPLSAEPLRRQLEKAIALDLEMRALYALQADGKANTATADAGLLSGQRVGTMLASER